MHSIHGISAYYGYFVHKIHQKNDFMKKQVDSIIDCKHTVHD